MKQRSFFRLPKLPGDSVLFRQWKNNGFFREFYTYAKCKSSQFKKKKITPTDWTGSIVFSGQESLTLATRSIHKMKQMEANYVKWLFPLLALLKIQKEKRIHLSFKAPLQILSVRYTVISKKMRILGSKNTSSDMDIKAL